MNGGIEGLGKLAEAGSGIAEKMQGAGSDSFINTVLNILGKIDPNVLKVLIIIAVLILIITIIKKAIKLAIIVIILALLISFLMPYVNNFKGASIDDEGIQIQLENMDDIVINKP